MLNTDRLQLQTHYLRQLPFTRETMKPMNAVTIYILTKICSCVPPCKAGFVLEEQQCQILTSIPFLSTAAWREADIFFSAKNRLSF